MTALHASMENSLELMGLAKMNARATSMTLVIMFVNSVLQAVRLVMPTLPSKIGLENELTVGMAIELHARNVMTIAKNAQGQTRTNENHATPTQVFQMVFVVAMMVGWAKQMIANHVV